MGLIGVVLAAAGPWLMPWFTNAADPQAAQVAAKGCVLLWIAAGYQLFDGFNIASGACLRGAGDVRVPSLMVLALSWALFVPLAHALSFQAGRRVGRLAAAVRAGRGRRLVRRADLRMLPGNDVVSALALGRVAPRGAAMMAHGAQRRIGLLRGGAAGGIRARFALDGGRTRPGRRTPSPPDRLAPASASFAVLDMESGRMVASFESRRRRAAPHPPSKS